MKLFKSLPGTKLLAGSVDICIQQYPYSILLERTVFSVLDCFIWNHLVAISQEAEIYAGHVDLRDIFSQLHEIVAFHIPSSSMQKGIRESLLQMGIRHFRPKQSTKPFYPAGIFTLVCEFLKCLQKSSGFVDLLRRFGLHALSNLKGRQRDKQHCKKT